ncbi:2-dehydro-3-deoxyphosphooctonate aldolase [bacterium BMS3Bbin11]|nr:2-dehydro-3-deoxyphosphooctonate aldolase [bacterium BMS3Abin11]GBE45355.1 2-dehydro-3-deoxyphosphooctonate aldolase [bacterium BMS3Bbin11]GMT39783.1 MAG: 2-dehydro-3-deoxyphosphooctonate aldolase [bacterium]HDH08891.1 3-deoxy-8-phosphooctulonate synthase [Gammaproteobacteria bacterium]HDH16355.1 3-deoxy-8-phosphooctulonate synthase [Gammaproteobacteria bacterium]
MQLLNFQVGLQHPFFLIAGPCVVESEQLAIDTAGTLAEITSELDIPFIFKSSYDKANRTSGQSYRGMGIDEGLKILDNVRQQTGVPVLTDVHSTTEVKTVAEVVDVLQTPAFLCRQTDLIEAVGACGKPVNIKKGQFLSPQEMTQVASKAIVAGGKGRVMVCERGVSFGYNNLVVDMRSLAIMRHTGCPVVFDVTHSVQQPGGQGTHSGGNREYIPVLARAAVAVGVAGLFMETHPDPDKALSDGPNSWPLARMKELLQHLKDIDQATRARKFEEQL